MAYLVQSNPTICIVHVEDCQKVGTSYIAYVTPELTDQQSLLFVLMLTTVYGKRKQNVADLRAFYKVHQDLLLFMYWRKLGLGVVSIHLAFSRRDQENSCV